MKLSIIFLTLLVVVAQTRPIIRRSPTGVNKISARQFGDFLSGVGDFFGVGGEDDAAADTNSGLGGDVLDTVTIGLDGNDNAGAAGSNGGFLDTVGGLFGFGNDDAGAAAPVSANTAPAPAPATPPAGAADPADVPPPPDVDAQAGAAQCSPSLQNVNAATVNLIQSFESFVPSPAPDPIGLPTVGFGHLCQRAGCSEVTDQGFTFPLSRADAEQLLQNDIAQFTTCVAQAVDPSIVLNENQFGALTSFSFNLGCEPLQTSTLLRRLNAGEDPNTVAAQELPKFRKAGGQVLNGLVRRRAAEVQLFQTPSNTIALPLCN